MDDRDCVLCGLGLDRGGRGAAGGRGGAEGALVVDSASCPFCPRGESDFGDSTGGPPNPKC
jgi:hypothetical protein